jgi:hypothetical protein
MPSSNPAVAWSPTAAKPASELAAVVQIRLLKREAETRRRNRWGSPSATPPPEVAAHRQVPELNAAGPHAIDVQPGVFLFVAQRAEDTLTEGRWRIGNRRSTSAMSSVARSS